MYWFLNQFYAICKKSLKKCMHDEWLTNSIRGILKSEFIAYMLLISSTNQTKELNSSSLSTLLNIIVVCFFYFPSPFLLSAKWWKEPAHFIRHEKGNMASASATLNWLQMKSWVTRMITFRWKMFGTIRFTSFWYLLFDFWIAFIIGVYVDLYIHWLIWLSGA